MQLPPVVQRNPVTYSVLKVCDLPDEFSFAAVTAVPPWSYKASMRTAEISWILQAIRTAAPASLHHAGSALSGRELQHLHVMKGYETDSQVRRKHRASASHEDKSPFWANISRR